MKKNSRQVLNTFRFGIPVELGLGKKLFLVASLLFQNCAAFQFEDFRSPYIPVASVSCHNPPTGNIPVVWNPYRLTITTAPIQFNFNIDSHGGGAVFVNNANDGICVFIQNSNRKIVKVSAPGLRRAPELVSLPDNKFELRIHCEFRCDAKPGLGAPSTSRLVIEYERFKSDPMPQSCPATTFTARQGSCNYEFPASDPGTPKTAINTAQGFRGKLDGTCRDDGAWDTSGLSCEPIPPSPPPTPPPTTIPPRIMIPPNAPFICYSANAGNVQGCSSNDVMICNSDSRGHWVEWVWQRGLSGNTSSTQRTWTSAGAGTSNAPKIGGSQYMDGYCRDYRYTIIKVE